MIQKLNNSDDDFILILWFWNNGMRFEALTISFYWYQLIATFRYYFVQHSVHTFSSWLQFFFFFQSVCAKSNRISNGVDASTMQNNRTIERDSSGLAAKITHKHQSGFKSAEIHSYKGTFNYFFGVGYLHKNITVVDRQTHTHTHASITIHRMWLHRKGQYAFLRSYFNSMQHHKSNSLFFAFIVEQRIA